MRQDVVAAVAAWLLSPSSHLADGLQFLPSIVDADKRRRKRRREKEVVRVPLRSSSRASAACGFVGHRRWRRLTGGGSRRRRRCTERLASTLQQREESQCDGPVPFLFHNKRSALFIPIGERVFGGYSGVLRSRRAESLRIKIRCLIRNKISLLLSFAFTTTFYHKFSIQRVYTRTAFWSNKVGIKEPI